MKIIRNVLNGANRMIIRLIEANLQSANLVGVNGLTIDQFSKVKSLYGAKLEPVLLEQVKEKYPHLLEEPE